MGSVFFLSVCALALTVVALLMWRYAVVSARRKDTNAFLDGQLGRRWQKAEQPVSKSAIAPWKTGVGVWDGLLLRAGVRAGPKFYFGFFAPIVVLSLIVLFVSGPMGAVAALVLTTLLSYFRLWYIANSRQRRMIAQLPDFLDGMVRLLTIGNSIGASFQSSAANVEEPLREVLRRADTLIRGGQEIDAALRQVSGQYDLRQLYLVAAVIGVALRFGGRSDQVLDRMSTFMRDIEQARDELSALSAETRLSAWILALLPVGLAAFIIMFNNALFMNMWNDPAGFKMLLGAVSLQIIGSFILYRMARAV